MSTKAYLNVGDCCIAVVTDYPMSPASIFTEDDQTVAPAWAAAEAASRAVSNKDRSEEEWDDVDVTYAVTVAQALDRLSALGVSWTMVERDFEAGRQAFLRTLDDESHQYRQPFKNAVSKTDLRAFLDVIVELLARGDVDRDWSETLKDFSIVGLIDDAWSGLGYELFTDSRCWLRAVLSVADADAVVSFDVASFFYQEELQLGDPLFDWYETDEFVNETEQTIVLTEGNVDRSVLMRTLPILYPHLRHYYTFMDFEEFRAPGGAGTLAGIVKAFAGARIRNRIVAVFDNDTAAASAVRGLRTVALPDNIRVVHLPHIYTASSYPTIGPSGMVTMDVNGMAGSIELYFGKDVLTKDGALVPVIWKGYDAGIQQYQGEVTHKSEIASRFEKKALACEQEDKIIGDWDDMQRVWRAIIDAFE